MGRFPHHRQLAFKPLVRAVALALVAGGCSQAQAAPAFSAAWFTSKGAVQGAAQATGYLPNGTSASTVMSAQMQQMVGERTQQSISRLNLAANSIAAQQAAQDAARTAALAGASSIPDGLAEGGLKVDSNSLTAGWINAKTPVQTVVDGRTTVTVQQTATSALLNWETFNVGRNTTLNFKQQSDWVVLNKVNDPLARPSQIAGQITADGTVMIVNRNGILFTGSSQINTRSLIASALPINDSLWNAGILYSNPDAKFTFSAYSETSGTLGPVEAFDAPAATASSQKSQVVVEAGAIISTPTTSDHNGGRVVLIGPAVSNRGTISTPDGQTILAAGQQVGLRPHLADDNVSSDSSLRGLDVYVGSILAPTVGIASPTVANSVDSNAVTGNASNYGIISAERGNISIAGANVNQLGVLQSTTSVAFNGRIDLQALSSTMAVMKDDKSGWLFKPSETGTVTLGAGSLTEILPEYDNTERAVGTSLALKSQVNITGQGVYLGEGARILAPNADVTIKAGNYYNYLFSYQGGQIYLDTGSTIDVSGSIVEAPVSENIIAVELRAAQLADSPLQLNGFLRGKTVYVDIRNTGTNADGTTWVGTPLADTSGYVGLIQRTVGELTTSGGSVTLNAGNSVVTKAGSLVNVANGWIDYQGGEVNTTRLLAADGRIIDISRATPDLVYVGLAGEWTRAHPRWGVSETYKSPIVSGLVYQAGYIQGGDGGSVSIQSPDLVLAGALQGSLVTGERQRSAPPGASSFSLNMVLDQVNSNSRGIAQAVTPDVIFQLGGDQRAVAAFDSVAAALDADSLDPKTPIVVSPGLVGQNGFGKVTITSGNGDIRIASALTGVAGGSLTLSGKNISIDANVVMPGGTINFKTANLDPKLDIKDFGDFAYHAMSVGRGVLTLGAGILLSTAGQIVDARAGVESNSPLALNGGSITLDGLDLDLQAGSVIDVSSGIKVAATGKQTGGKGGTLSLTGGVDWRIDPALSHLVHLDAQLKGYGSGTGGTLSIAVPRIQIGGTNSSLDTLLFASDFFNQGGFSNFSLAARLGLTVAAGTSIAPVVQSYALAPDGNTLAPTLLPATLRSPVSLALSATGYQDAVRLVYVPADLVMAEGASIRIDPTLSGAGSVSINTAWDDSVKYSTAPFDSATILGAIVVPGGTITIKGNYANPNSSVVTDPNVVLGANSVLSTVGTSVLAPADARGLRLGKVLAGGNITLSGNIVAPAGALIDVSGASGIIDIAVLSSLDRSLDSLYVPTTIASDAGSITFGGQLSIAATLRGAPGASSANGGKLTVSGGKSFLTDPGPSLFVTQHVADVSPFLPSSTDPARPQFAIDSFEDGGFDYLTLKGNVGFTGPVAVTARGAITVATGGLIKADNAVSLTAPYVAIGLPYASQSAVNGVPYVFVQTDSSHGTAVAVYPTFGAGSLAVNASLIDVGTLLTQTIGAVNLNATGGDIRGYGTLTVMGDIALTAGQVYPTTAAYFTIAAFDHGAIPGSVTVNAGGSRSLPLSAGGTLNIFASDIDQNGVLRAPLGTINLGSITAQTGGNPTLAAAAQMTFATTDTLSLGTGSVTSVSAVDPVSGDALLLPYGTETNGTAWINPYGKDITVSGVPSKSITVSANNVTIGAGATLDLSGGGDLFSNNWVKGLGGSKDILASSSSFAIVPGYLAAYAPLVSMGTQTGWSNSALAVGDRIWLNASSGLAAGYYTLLPARYALLPGAFLVTKTSATGAAGISIAKTDGSSLVTGYRGNAFNASQSALPGIFEVASAAVVKARAENNVYYANQTLRASALANDAIVPRLPIDAGQLVLSATHTMVIKGRAMMGAPSGGLGGLGGLIDISSPSNIVINADGSGTDANTLYLSAPGLSAFGAQSLLIGGMRRLTSGGLAVDVSTASIELANDKDSVLSSPEIILASNGSLTLDAGSAVAQSGSLSSASQTLLIGTAPAADQPKTGSGDGALLRVSSDSSASIVRSDVISNTAAVNFVVGAGASISGNGIILDSTSATTFDSTAHLSGSAVTLGSGQISLQLDNAGPLQPTTGLVLPNAVLAGLQSAIGALSLFSYSSIDIYGTGAVGGVDAAGRPLVDSLTLHAAGIRGFNANGGTATLNAKQVVIDNSPNGEAVNAVTGANDTPSGSLVFNAETIRVGANPVNVVGYADLNLRASGGLLLTGAGGLSTVGNLTMNVATITAGKAARQSLMAGGALTVNAVAGMPTVVGGLGADLTLAGARVDMNGTISLPSGTITLHATGAASGSDITVGGTLDAGGTAVAYFDQIAYSNGGKVVLTSDNGSVDLAVGSLVNVAAASATGDAGSIKVSAPKGIFKAAGTLAGQAGANGTGGSFILDVGSQPSLASLSATLNAGGFDAARTIRVRTGNVTVDGTARAAIFDLAADSGAITVSGTIDASGQTGGQIGLYGYNGITLASGSLLTVAAEAFDAAGKGGAVDIETGQAKNINGVMTVGTGWIDLQQGSTIDLSVAGGVGGTLHLRAPQTTGVGSSTPTAVGNGTAGSGNTGGIDVAIKPLGGAITNAASIVVEGFQVFDLTGAGAITTAVRTNASANASSFATHMAAIAGRLLNGTPNSGLGTTFHVQPGEELVTRSGDLTLPKYVLNTNKGNWDLSTMRYGSTGEPGILTLRTAGNLVFLSALSDGFAPTKIDATSGLTRAMTAVELATTLSSTLLPAGSRSWAYRLVAGADLSGAEFREVLPLTGLADTSGSVQVGVPGTTATSTTTTAAASAGYMQSIRTGTGDIDIVAARDVQILNQFSTIYTAGSRVTPGSVASTTLTAGTASVSLAANLPVTFSGGTGTNFITSTVDGVVNITDPASGLVLPAGTVYTFANGFSSNSTPVTTKPGNFVTKLSVGTSTTVELTTSAAGAVLSVIPDGSTISGFAAGAKVYLATAISDGVLTASGPCVVYANGVATAYAAGQALPAMNAQYGSFYTYIVLTNGGTLTRNGSSGALGLSLPVGDFTLSVASASNPIIFKYLPTGSKLTLFSDGAIQYANSGADAYIPQYVATVPLVAYTATTFLLPVNSSVTLSSSGTITLIDTAGNSVSVTKTVADASGNTYLFDAPITGSDGRNYALYSTVTSGQSVAPPAPYSSAQYSSGGGNINISAGRDIIHLKSGGADDSSQQLPVNWLYRRSSVSDGVFNRDYYGDMASTTWWVDYSNFFEGVGTLGGGNLTMRAGQDVKNVDGLVATNAWMSYKTVKADGSVDTLAANQKLTEYGGGNLIVTAGRDINAGVYYVEKGHGSLAAGGAITTNATRSTTYNAATSYSDNPLDWMATMLFLGKGSFDLSARGDIKLGSVANAFLLPQGLLNGTWDRSYFSTYDASDSVNLSSLTGNIVFKESGDPAGSNTVYSGTLAAWFSNVLGYYSTSGNVMTVSSSRPWLRLTETAIPVTSHEYSTYVAWISPMGSVQHGGTLGQTYIGQIDLMPASLTASAFSGDIRIGGTITLAPSAVGTVNLLAAGSIDGLQNTSTSSSDNNYSVGAIKLSDLDPDLIPSITAPMTLQYTSSPLSVWTTDVTAFSPLVSVAAFNALFAENGTTGSRNAQQALHDSGLLHRNDPEPVRLYAGSGDISGLQVFSAKRAQIIAGHDITDVAFYLQNLTATDVSQVIAGRDIVLYNENSKARQAAGVTTDAYGVLGLTPASGDLSIGGPGALEVLAGRNLTLGGTPSNATQAETFTTAGLGKGIVSVGNARNPYLPATGGASITAAAGLGLPTAAGLSGSGLDIASFIAAFLDPATAGALAERYLPVLGERLGLAGASNASIWQAFAQTAAAQKELYALDIFYLALRDTGRDHLSGASSGYAMGYQAIAKLFPGTAWKGDITLTGREIKTAMGGDINLLVPGGKLLVGYALDGTPPLEQGIMTLSSGNISIFSQGDVAIGSTRIFTFKGGNEIIWSALGNIAAGSASKTLQSAPPTKIIIDPTTGTLSIDIGGLATGGGIGTLQTVKGAPPGDVDLIAPAGYIDAGDAGIRCSRNCSISAPVIINPGNIVAQGKTTGVPLVAVVNVAALSNASAAASQASAAAQDVSQGDRAAARKNLPSVFTVRVLGFGDDSVNVEGSRKGANAASASRYDPSGVVQVLGAGALTLAQTQVLTERERRSLAP